MFFKKKKDLNLDDFEKIMKRLIVLEAEQEKIRSLFISLRTFVHRRFKKESGEYPESENLNSPDGLDSIRGLTKKDG